MTSVESILGAVRDALISSGRSLLVDDASFGHSLRIGQVLKGRVLRHYEGSRYLMDFGGQERVVDSSLPLRISEAVTARVVAVGDQVHLQRLRSDGESASELVDGVRAARPDATPRELALHALFEQYNAALEPSELAALAQTLRRAANPGMMSLSALVLHKIGVALVPELLEAMYSRLEGARPPVAGQAASRQRLVADPAAASESSERALEFVAGRLRALAGNSEPLQPVGAEPGRAPDRPAGDGGGEAGDERGFGSEAGWQWLLGQWLLNAQSHPRIAHRLVQLPLWLGDRVVEVSVALFSEGGPGPRAGVAGSFPFQRAVLFLELDRLGRVQITLGAADRSLRVAVATNDEAANDALARNATDLRASLGALGWQVAELKYVQTQLSPNGEVVDAVVHHHITQDSLSRWM